ncbi:hypothetical protein [Sutcliffiella cohnii]|uniref:hypothetical protein n=1 Tax=Sutcliffiella cohnii TaxID=33932 RepID=UPI0008373D67|nr:hypothetical protein [Sutcliffiella cohnii]
MQIREKEIHKFSQEQLTEHFNNNNQFIKDYATMFYYYANTFNNIVSEDMREEFQSRLYESVKTQYYNGYFIAREFLAHEETEVPDGWLTQPEGIMKQQIPPMLFDAAGGDFAEIVRTETSQKLVSWSITKFENIRSLLQEVIIDVTLLGSFRAFIDERNIRGLNVRASGNEVEMGILAPYNDFHFIDPQKYLLCLLNHQDTEVWEIHLWSSIQVEKTKVGEVSIHRLTNQTLQSMYNNLPIYQGLEVNGENHEMFYISISILGEYESDLNPITEEILGSIAKNTDIDTNNIAVNVSVINRFN